MRNGLIPAGVVGAVAVLAALVVTAPAVAGTRLIPGGTTTVIRPGVTGADGLQQPELRPGEEEEDGGDVANRPRPGFKNGKFPHAPLDAPTVSSSVVAGSNPELDAELSRTQSP